ncbi:unnamed protein product [Paramecium primaurelia]|uniref:Uncharacterized protein n=1 Tax=Paramecium primaurelia TaxID=5886 RepID=A0A8S1MLP9_PARPR|nr:unnamed protein product [Paramecium primaurelia]
MSIYQNNFSNYRMTLDKQIQGDQFEFISPQIYQGMEQDSNHPQIYDFSEQFQLIQQQGIGDLGDTLGREYNLQNFENEFPFINGQQYYQQNSLTSQNSLSKTKYDIQEIDDENQSSKKKLIKKQKIQTALPGESKNLHKCYGRQLQLFIKNFCNKTNNLIVKENQDIMQFLQIPGDKIGKCELNQILNSPLGKIISKEFFGQCLWKYNVVKESKTSVSSLFRHNIEPFWEVNKKKKLAM